MFLTLILLNDNFQVVVYLHTCTYIERTHLTDILLKDSPCVSYFLKQSYS